MKISVEVSMYPLLPDYVPPIKAFLKQLHQFEDIRIKTNSMSTQIFGPYDQVMKALQESMRFSFEQKEKIVMVMKVINMDLDYEYKGD